MRKICLLIILLTTSLSYYVYYDYSSFINTPLKKDLLGEVYKIKRGDNLNIIADSLNKSNAFKKRYHKYYFILNGRLLGKAKSIKAGTYKINSDLKPNDFLDLIIEGNPAKFSIQFIEGWTFKDFLKEIDENKNIEKTMDYNNPKKVMKELGFSDIFYEGLFFPDTYYIDYGTKDKDVLLRAYEEMQKKLSTIWKERGIGNSKYIDTPYKLLILASLIEKETSIDSEREEISGVFYRRLEKGMKLQTDPSVIYGLQDNYKGKIFKKDLKKDTPYNTYTRNGLPPSPIASPSKRSLFAAANPKEGTSLYFVADGNGGHRFSDTYKEHLKNVKLYRERKNKSK